MGGRSSLGSKFLSHWQEITFLICLSLNFKAKPRVIKGRKTAGPAKGGMTDLPKEKPFIMEGLSMKKLTVLVAVLVMVFGLTVSANAMTYAWRTLDYGAFETSPVGIDGSNIVGLYYDDASAMVHGFLYDGTTWRTLDAPTPFETWLAGIDGSNIVGHYWGAHGMAYGFVYDGTTWRTLNYPGADWTSPSDIDGSNIVGDYSDASGWHGFLYDGTAWTPLNYPGATETSPVGIDGSNIVGFYWGANEVRHGFVYDGTTWRTLNYPGADWTSPSGIDGSNIVGYYSDASGWHGFLYDGTNWSTLDYPGALSTLANSIDSNNIVGDYFDASGVGHGFLATPVPEPATLLLLSSGLLGILGLRRKFKK
jgi:hypothetical protein